MVRRGVELVCMALGYAWIVLFAGGVVVAVLEGLRDAAVWLLGVRG